MFSVSCMSCVSVGMSLPWISSGLKPACIYPVTIRNHEMHLKHDEEETLVVFCRADFAAIVLLGVQTLVCDQQTCFHRTYVSDL